MNWYFYLYNQLEFVIVLLERLICILLVPLDYNYISINNQSIINLFLSFFLHLYVSSAKTFHGGFVRAYTFAKNWITFTRQRLWRVHANQLQVGTLRIRSWEILVDPLFKSTKMYDHIHLTIIKPLNSIR